MKTELKLKIILTILGLLTIFYLNRTNIDTGTTYDNSNLLYMRDYDNKILHLPDCFLVDDFVDFGCIFTDDGYFVATVDGYVHCDFCLK